MPEITANSAPAMNPIVHIIDDDAGVRRSLEDLCGSVGYDVATYASPAAFLDRDQTDQLGCLILDVRLPGVNGLDFLEELARDGHSPPVILISGFGDIPMSVRGMKAGAIDFIEKPFRDQDLLDAVASAIDQGRRKLNANLRQETAQKRFETLSPREREVIGRVITGRLNKQIAFELSISEVTVKIHRAAAMRKLGVRSIVELARLAESIGL